MNQKTLLGASTLAVCVATMISGAQAAELPLQQPENPRFIPNGDGFIVLQGPDVTRQASVNGYSTSRTISDVHLGTGKGPYRALIRFDLSRIAGHGKVKDAALMLHVDHEVNPNQGITFGVHAVNTEWLEGEVTWGQPRKGTPWKPEGTDSTPAAKFTIPPLYGRNWVFVHAPGFTALVNDWLTGKRTNEGIICICASEFSAARTERQFAGKGAGATAPKLVLSYRVPIDPARFGALSSHALRLTPFDGEALPKETAGDCIRLNRDISSLCERINEVARRLPDRAAMEAIKQRVRKAFADLDRRLTPETLTAARKMLHASAGKWLAAVLQQLYPGHDLFVEVAPPFERLDTNYVPGARRDAGAAGKTASLAFLKGEYQAAGVVVTNLTAEQTTCRIRMKGLPADAFEIVIRKQVFLEDWYMREQELIADPLPRLAKEGDMWILALAAGESAKLCVTLHHASGRVGTWSAAIEVVSPGQAPSTVPLTVTVLPEMPPEDTGFAHLEFMYFYHNSARKFGRVMARDLYAHRVLAVEFEGRPPATFTKEGELVQADFSEYERRLKEFGADMPVFMIFWAESRTPLKTTAGTQLEYPSPAHKHATIALLRGWLDRAAKLGFGAERFAYLVVDEPGSGKLADSPSRHVLEIADMAKSLHREVPELRLVCTFSYYTYPKDAEQLIPWLDITVPTYPMATRLSPANAPPEYSPARAFVQSTYPKLLVEREKRGLQVWSYHVASGKRDDVFKYNRLYPLTSVALGYTGISFWAYNTYKASSWHDWDGKGSVRLDYSFIYDGLEDNPICKEVNVTREPIVPSIRWEAVRAGVQDAMVLLALKQAGCRGLLDRNSSVRLNAWLEMLRAANAGTQSIGFADVNKLSGELRQAYVALRKSEPR